MKIAVYTIALNEEQFVKRWAESAKNADYVLIADTGSSDGTISIANSIPYVNVINISVSPWRFDNARNEALAALPDDIDLCIALDMDEVLVDGWRQLLESSSVNRPRYKYVWSWNDDGSEGLVYGGDKIHGRHTHFWKHPVHEVLKPLSDESQEWIDGFEIHHHPDSSKSRSQYFDLLKLAVEEDMNDDRNQFYLAREYFFNNNFDDAAHHFKIHLTLSSWSPERAASCRYLSKCEPDKSLYWLYRAVAEDSSRRENWFALMRHYYDIANYSALVYATNMALLIEDKPLDYLCDADSWGWQFYDLAAIGFYYTGDYERAKFYGSKALISSPNDERLKNNMVFYNGFATVN